MPNAVAEAVTNYIRACLERDPTARQALFEASLADDVRMVTRSREICGRTQLVRELVRFLDDPRVLRVRVVSAIDAAGTTFRYRATAEFNDGTSAETFDAGEIDGSGRISLILTFAGPLLDADVVGDAASHRA